MSSPALDALSAPERFANWLATNQQLSRTDGRMYNYLPRSDSHSIAICDFIVQDLVQRCPVIRGKAAEGKISYGLNVLHMWPNGKKKTLDLVIGVPEYANTLPPANGTISRATSFSRVLVSGEAKNCMTEHKKSQPRLFDELSSSHEIVHQGDQHCIALGIAVVNIAKTFVSPLRQKTGLPVEVTNHRQPDVAASMIAHLRGLPFSSGVGKVGFDAFTTIVVDCCNTGGATLHVGSPAPQPGEPDHYDTFLNRVCTAFAERFPDI